MQEASTAPQSPLNETAPALETEPQKPAKRRVTKAETVVAEKWTAELVTRGHTPVVNVFLDCYSRLNPKLTATEAMCLVHLMRYKWTKEAPFPSLRSIAEQMGVSQQMVRQYVRSIEKKGFLFREKRKGFTNLYHFGKLFSALATAKRVQDAERAQQAAQYNQSQYGIPPTDVAAAG